MLRAVRRVHHRRVPAGGDGARPRLARLHVHDDHAQARKLGLGCHMTWRSPRFDCRVAAGLGPATVPSAGGCGVGGPTQGAQGRPDRHAAPELRPPDERGLCPLMQRLIVLKLPNLQCARTLAYIKVVSTPRVH